jgi:hypothetical protein
MTTSRVRRRPPEATDEDHVAEPPAAPTASPWRVASGIASQTAVLVAVLFYFGWVSARETFGYFGVDLSLLGFSTPDVLLRSLYPGYQPLLVLAVCGLLALCVHQGAVHAAARNDRVRRAARWLPVAALVAGAALLGPAILGLVVSDATRVLPTILPAALAIGALLVAYADKAWPALRGSRNQSPRSEDRRLRGFAFLALAALGAFWWIALYAGESGRENARQIARNLPYRTEVAVYATKRLSIPLYDGVHEEHFPDETLKYQYRYTGLRLLVHAGGRYFLVPSGWKRGVSPAIQIPDDGDVRLDYITTREPAT